MGDVKQQRTAFWSRKLDACWGAACTKPAAPDDEQRWRGHYCRDCQHRLRADAARIEEEETSHV